MSRAWVDRAESFVLQAAELGGYVLTSWRCVSKFRSRYLVLDHPSRPRLCVGVSDHRSREWRQPTGRTCTAFDVHTAGGVSQLVQMLRRGRLSITPDALRPGQAETPVSGRGEGEAEPAAALTYEGGNDRGGTGELPTAPMKASALSVRTTASRRPGGEP